MVSKTRTRASLEDELLKLQREFEAAGGKGAFVDGAIKWPSDNGHTLDAVINHLDIDYSDTAKCQILFCIRGVRTLLPRQWSRLAEIFRRTDDGNARVIVAEGEFPPMSKTLLANLLTSHFERRHLSELFGLIKDRSQGETRMILLQPLRRRRGNPEIESFLKKMADDPQLATELGAWNPPVR